MIKKIVLTALAFQVFSIAVFAQTRTKELVLQNTAQAHSQKEIANFKLALQLAEEKGWAPSFTTGNGNIAFLVGVRPDGSPIYLATESNVTAANTIGVNHLWAGGSSGLNLSGSSANVKDKMAIWDGGRVRATHKELINRVVQLDGAASNSDHATHVAGTMMATGINPNSKGMAHGIQGIVAYDFNNHVSEMFGKAASLLVSNHSYGSITGWSYNSSLTRWEFHGAVGENEDRNFGYYNSEAQLWDSIAYNAPYYLIVKSAGNNRNDNGPAVGATFWRRDASNTWVSAPRPEGISSNDSYGIISTYGTAKNMLTIGAVNGLVNGYQGAFGVSTSSFSSWGPTDDGRIKPDLVSMGVSLNSTFATHDSAYATISGTSMSAPNVTGAMLLLQEYYSQLNQGAFMRASTLKAVAIHTADEAGFFAGPDYTFGWGLVNANKAANVIKSKNLGSHRIMENVLNNGQTFTTNIVADGPLTFTLVWTDPKGTVITSNILNNPELKLVHDLDMRVTKATTTFSPWILDPANPSSQATTGDNFRDNVEKININGAVAGETYIITINHKGNLQRGSQAYSLIISGVGGPVYCASGATSSTGARIDSVSFGGIAKQNPAGCTTYTNHTSVTGSVQPAQVLPIFVALNSCDAGTANKIAKVFIDWNANGSFDDAGELVATSNVIAGNGSFTANVTAPGNISVGNSTTMRIVMVETSDASTVTSCGVYANGETQDYTISFTAPANDMIITAVEGPKNNACENPSQFVTVKIKNNGTTAKTNIPVALEIKNGTTVVSTITGMFTGTIAAGATVNYTFQTPYNNQAGNTYTFKATVSDPADQVTSNDVFETNVSIAQNPPAPAAGGVICGSTAMMKVTNPVGGAHYFWYADAASNTPFATGVSATTTSIPANNTFFVGSGARGTVGLSSKSAFAGGGSYVSTTDLTTSNYMRYTSAVPLVLETAKLYIKQGGKINFIVGTLSGTTVNVISTTTIDVYPTSSNPSGGNQPNDPNDVGAEYLLNLSLPAGDHVILVQTLGDANIFRNDNLTGNPYPYSIPGIISFTGNSAGTNFQNFYFYLYNMKIRTTGCISPKTTVVTSVAPVPTITQAGDSLMSSIAVGNQWYLNNISLNGANGQKYKPLASGNYTVRVSDSYGCEMTSTVFNFIGTSVVNLPSSEIGLTVSPNPNKGSFVLRFNVEKRDDLKIEMFNIQGQNVMSKSYSRFQGLFTEQMNIRNIAAGLYVISVRHGNKVYHSKIVVE
jgi:hypothetical protein